MSIDETLDFLLLLFIRQMIQKCCKVQIVWCNVIRIETTYKQDISFLRVEVPRQIRVRYCIVLSNSLLFQKENRLCFVFPLHLLSAFWLSLCRIVSFRLHSWYRNLFHLQTGKVFLRHFPHEEDNQIGEMENRKKA